MPFCRTERGCASCLRADCWGIRRLYGIRFSAACAQVACAWAACVRVCVWVVCVRDRPLREALSALFPLPSRSLSALFPLFRPLYSSIANVVDVRAYAALAVCAALELNPLRIHHTAMPAMPCAQ